jgi:hypothetical protein
MISLLCRGNLQYLLRLETPDVRRAAEAHMSWGNWFGSRFCLWGTDLTGILGEMREQGYAYDAKRLLK